MPAHLKRLFWPPVVNDDYLEAARRRCVVVISITAGLVGLWSGSRNLVASFDQYPIQTILSLAAPLLLLACPALIAMNVSTKKVAWFFLLVTFAAMLAVPLIAGGMFSRATFFMLAWAVLTTLFLGWKEGIGAAALVFASYLMFHYLRSDISPSVYDINAEMISSWLLFSLSITLLVLIIGAAIIQREMERATVKLVEARAEAEAANRAKSEFLAKISHEIRTPMNGILGMAEMLKKSNLSGEQTNFANTIVSSGESLMTIINDILDFSKIEAGRLALREETFFLKGVIGQIHTLFQPIANQRQIELIVDYDDRLPDYLYGDAGRIRQILINLLGNALKFTENGSVKISVSGDVVGDDVSLKFHVEDTGVGIPADKLESIFESFEQVDLASSRRAAGTGLGLAISRQIANAMGGEINVCSAPGFGSTFTLSITLPISAERHDATEALPASQSHEAQERGDQRIRVLAAEDNDVNRLVLKSMIDADCCTLDFAVNGAEAVKAYKANKYDVVLMDVWMPEMDGTEAARAIRDYERETGAAPTPIICLTAHVVKSCADDVLEAGMDDILTKPLKAKDVMAAVVKWAAAPHDERKTA